LATLPPTLPPAPTGISQIILLAASSSHSSSATADPSSAFFLEVARFPVTYCTILIPFLLGAVMLMALTAMQQIVQYLV
jgi:hypothetical protein